MAFRYHFGGVEIASEIPLTGLRAAREDLAGTAGIRVIEGKGRAPVEDRLHHAWDGRFRMRLGEADGQWLMGSPWGSLLFDRHASVVRFFANDGPDSKILKDLFVRRLLPRLVKLKGGWAYHAASLARRDKGILVMGQSGAGKSTLSVGLAAMAGWDILGDDMALIWNDDAERVAPAARDVAIWPQSCDGLGLAEEDCEPLLAYDGKRAYRPHRGDRLDPVPLHGIFFLNRTDCAVPSVERHSRAEAFTRALAQVIYFNPSGPAAEERVASLTHLNAMLGRVPAWTLTYPESYGLLEAVSATLSATVEDA